MSILRNIVAGIEPTDKSAMVKAVDRIDNLVKPIGSLGTLEKIATQLAGIFGSSNNKLVKCTIVMAADNGIYDEGVSVCPQEITAMQTINMLKGITGISVLSKHAGADIRVIDIGIKTDMEYPGLINKKIKNSTGNIAQEAAMTRADAEKAMEIGIEIVEQLVKEGYNLLGTGEMGICNTSTSSAVLMAFTGCGSDIAVGKGAGLTEDGFQNKKRVVEKAIAKNKPDNNDPIDVVSKVGGLDIAGLTGCFLAAAYYKIPIVIDGFISGVAALAAYKMNPLVREYMIPSHLSEEPGFKLLMEELNLEPILNLHMRLGEGTGCPLAFNIIEAAQKMICNMATFEEAGIISDTLIDIR